MAYRHDDDDYIARCNAKCAPDDADFPHEWTSEQRNSARWYAHARGITVDATPEWYGVAAAAARDAERHKAQRAGLDKPNTDIDDFWEE